MKMTATILALVALTTLAPCALVAEGAPTVLLTKATSCVAPFPVQASETQVNPAPGDLPLAPQLNPPEQQSPIFLAGCGAWCRDNCTIFGEPCCILSWDPPLCGCC